MHRDFVVEREAKRELREREASRKTKRQSAEGAEEAGGEGTAPHPVMLGATKRARLSAPNAGEDAPAAVTSVKKTASKKINYEAVQVSRLISLIDF